MACISSNPLRAHISGFLTDTKENAICYRIQVETKEWVSWTVERRYSDFEALHKKLIDSQGITVALPPKKLIGNMDPEFVEKRREQLDGYLKNLIQLLGKNPPQELAVFLDLYDYEILFMLRKLALDIFEKGDRYIETGESYSISPYQIYAINERLKMALPPLDTADKRHDFSHIVDFCTTLKWLEIVGSNIPIGRSTIIPNHYSMDLSTFKSLNDLALKFVNLENLTEVSTARKTLTRLSVHTSNLSSTSQILLCDTLYKTFEKAGSAYVWANLTSLNLSNNELRSVTDLGSLAPALRHLDLSFNQLSNVFNLTPLPYLEQVSYAGNVLTLIEDLHLSFGNVRILDLSQNQIEDLSGFARVYSLAVINLACNRVRSVQEVQNLADLPCLELLTLTGNPVAASLDYRVRALSYFGPRANDVVLDNERASLTEIDQISIIQAIEMARRTTRAKPL